MRPAKRVGHGVIQRMVHSLLKGTLVLSRIVERGRPSGKTMVLASPAGVAYIGNLLE